LTEYVPLQYDESRRQGIIDHLRTIFASKTLAEWKESLAGVDCCWAPVQNFAEVLEDPFFAEREMVVTTGDPDPKRAKTMGVPIKLSDTPGGVRTLPDNFGESTAAVLKGLGYSDQEIKQFSDSGVTI
jgi:crotonobetainyl-CoA:carnitine CoA-transferase CaiB-like acyl-CoA transferase